MSKASFFGVTSAAVHGVAALAFTSLPPTTVPTASTASLVWMATSAEGAGHDEQGAAGPVSTSVAPRPTVRAHAPRKRVKREAAPVSEAAEAASDEHLPSTVGEVASAQASASASAAESAGDAASEEGSGGGNGVGVGTAGKGGEGGVGNGSGLAHGPGLIAHGAPCKGYFPAQAHADEGEVRIEVTVDERGHTRATAVLAEMPKGNGFGVAASACANHLHFDPAIDNSGSRVAGRAKLLLRFRRG